MNEMEKYLDALAAAAEAKNKKAIELLDAFSAYVYHEIHAKSDSSTGEDKVVWDGMLQRVKVIMAKMAQAGPQIW
jgi:hypothetical protein